MIASCLRRLRVLEAHPFRQEFSMAEISPLRRRMIEDMTVRNLSPATQQSYLASSLPIGSEVAEILWGWRLRFRGNGIWRPETKAQKGPL
jgi:hypothetical protein